MRAPTLDAESFDETRESAVDSSARALGPLAETMPPGRFEANLLRDSDWISDGRLLLRFSSSSDPELAKDLASRPLRATHPPMFDPVRVRESLAAWSHKIEAAPLKATPVSVWGAKAGRFAEQSAWQVEFELDEGARGRVAVIAEGDRALVARWAGEPVRWRGSENVPVLEARRISNAQLVGYAFLPHAPQRRGFRVILERGPAYAGGSIGTPEEFLAHAEPGRVRWVESREHKEPVAIFERDRISGELRTLPVSVLKGRVGQEVRDIPGQSYGETARAWQKSHKSAMPWDWSREGPRIGPRLPSAPESGLELQRGRSEALEPMALPPPPPPGPPARPVPGSKPPWWSRSGVISSEALEGIFDRFEGVSVGIEVLGMAAEVPFSCDATRGPNTVFSYKCWQPGVARERFVSPPSDFDVHTTDEARPWEVMARDIAQRTGATPSIREVVTSHIKEAESLISLEMVEEAFSLAPRRSIEAELEWFDRLSVKIRRNSDGVLLVLDPWSHGDRTGIKLDQWASRYNALTGWRPTPRVVRFEEESERFPWKPAKLRKPLPMRALLDATRDPGKRVALMAPSHRKVEFSHFENNAMALMENLLKRGPGTVLHVDVVGWKPDGVVAVATSGATLEWLPDVKWPDADLEVLNAGRVRSFKELVSSIPRKRGDSNSFFCRELGRFALPVRYLPPMDKSTTVFDLDNNRSLPGAATSIEGAARVAERLNQAWRMDERSKALR